MAKQPWEANITFKDENTNLFFPERCLIKEDTIEKVLRKLLKKPHKTFFGVKRIIIKRSKVAQKKKKTKRSR